MTIFTYRSTMLPNNVLHRADTSELDADEFGEFCNACNASFEAHGQQAEFRLSFEDVDNDVQWLHDRVAPKWSSPRELMRLLYAAIEEGWGDEAMVMAVYYAGRWTNDADRVIGAVQSEEWCIDYNENEERAYVDYAKKKLDDDGETLADGLESYFDFSGYGRACADACIRFSDGDFYVFNEWH